MASNETTLSPNVACDYFCKAAGIFKLLSDEYTGMISIPTVCDLHPISIQCSLKLCLAKAQECFILKAQGKDNLILKLSASCADLYELAHDALNASPSLVSAYGPVMSPTHIIEVTIHLPDTLLTML